MVIVTLTKKEKIGRITKLIPLQFEVPEKIVCPDDGAIMEYQSWTDNYVCSECKKAIRVTDFIKSEMEKNNQTTLSK